MSFSFIIPIFNTYGLSQLIDNILSIVNNNILYEIIFIDDGSDEEYISYYHDCISISNKISYFYLPNKKGRYRLAEAKNLGAKMSKLQTLVFLDQDTFLHQNYLNQILDRYVGGIIGGSMLGFNNLSKRLDREIQEEFYINGCIKNPSFVDIRDIPGYISDFSWSKVYGTNMILDKSTFHYIGGFDENFTGWGIEDNEFCYRGYKLGLRVAYEPLISILNIGENLYDDTGILSSRKNVCNGVKNLIYFYKKYKTQDVREFCFNTLKIFKRYLIAHKNK